MLRVAVFSIITFAIAYLLYVLPVLWLLSLFSGGEMFAFWTLVPTAVVFALLRLYLATSVTNRWLKGFVYYGMGIGFLAVLILSALLLVQWLGGFDGPVLGSMAILAIGGVTVLSVHNANSFVTRHLTVSTDRIDSPKRFAFISDVHIGSNPPRHLEAICDHLRQTDIDALLIGGDLFDSSDFQLEDIAALQTVEPDIFFITGNHEGYVGGFESMLARFPELGITVLENEAVAVHGVNLIGISDAQPTAAKIEAVERLCRDNSFNLALVHQPSIWGKTKRDVDLMLCGHTHNGQIFPFNLLVRLQFRHVYGRFSAAASQLYVSSGVGSWGPRMRLGSRNEIIIIDLLPSGQSVAAG